MNLHFLKLYAMPKIH